MEGKLGLFRSWGLDETGTLATPAGRAKVWATGQSAQPATMEPTTLRVSQIEGERARGRLATR